jgi:uncharacterized protein (TIGR03067 family)
VIVLSVWTAAVLCAAGPESDKELQKLQGAWVMVSGEVDGSKVADEHAAKSKITYEDGKGLLVVPNQHGEPIVFEIVKIDAAKSPKEMHFVRKNGPSAGKTIIAIYEFQGDDQYKFAFDPAGVITLQEFATKQGTGHIHNIWKREKGAQ